MATESKYGTWRTLFVFLCIFLAAIALVRVIRSSNPGTVPNSRSIANNYQRRFCDDRKTIDYGNKNPEKLVLPLHDGCYGDRIVLPVAWLTFEPSLSSNPGDYASVWCDEEPNPRRTVAYTGDMHGTMNDCPAGRASAKFSLEGNGTLTLVRTQTNQNVNIRAKEEIPETSYKVSPTLPTSGGDPDFSMVINECHRSGDQVRCLGMVTNNTDAPRSTDLHDSSAVDDEGNSFFIATFGGGISFAGDAATGGLRARLMPSVPTKFSVTISDAHRNVKAINLQISVDWLGNASIATLIFEGIPVQ